MKKLLALSILLISAYPAGASHLAGGTTAGGTTTTAITTNTSAETTETAITTNTSTNTSTNTVKVDALEKAIRAKSDALSGRLKFGSLSSLPTTDKNGTYDQQAIQVVEALRNAVRGNDLKSYSKSLSKSSQSSKYNSILASEKAAVEAAKAAQIIEEAEKKEESKDPIVTPEKGETEEKGEAVITWEFDTTTGKYVEYSDGKATGNTKDAVDNFSKETDTIQWAVDDKQVYVEHLTTKKVVIGATEVTVYLRADGSIYALVDDENTIKWKDADEQLKPMVEGALYRLQLEESTNYKEYQSNGRTYRVYMNDAGNITDFCIMADGEIDKVMGWDRFTDEQKAEVLSHLNGKASSEKSKEEQPKSNEYTYEWKGTQITVYYNDDESISKVFLERDGETALYAWDELGDDAHQEITAELNKYLHPSSSEEQTKENYVSQIDAKGNILKYYYDDEKAFVKWELVTPEGELIHSASASEMPYDEISFNQEKLNEMLNSSSSEETITLYHKVVQSLSGDNVNVYYDATNNVVSIGIMDENGIEVFNQSVDDMDEASRVYYQQQLNERLNPPAPVAPVGQTTTFDYDLNDCTYIEVDSSGEIVSNGKFEATYVYDPIKDVAKVYATYPGEDKKYVGDVSVLTYYDYSKLTKVVVLQNIEGIVVKDAVGLTKTIDYTNRIVKYTDIDTGNVVEKNELSTNIDTENNVVTYVDRYNNVTVATHTITIEGDLYGSHKIYDQETGECIEIVELGDGVTAPEQ